MDVHFLCLLIINFANSMSICFTYEAIRLLLVILCYSYYISIGQKMDFIDNIIHYNEV